MERIRRAATVHELYPGREVTRVAKRRVIVVPQLVGNERGVLCAYAKCDHCTGVADHRLTQEGRKLP